MNKMIVIGNLTRAPELHAMQDGSPVCNFTVAVNRRLRNGEKAADFIRVSVWGHQADACQKYLDKGSTVSVVGRASARGYTANDGSIRAEISITATEVEFVGSRRSGGEQMPNDEYQEVDESEIPFSEQYAGT